MDYFFQNNVYTIIYFIHLHFNNDFLEIVMFLVFVSIFVFFFIKIICPSCILSLAMKPCSPLTKIKISRLYLDSPFQNLHYIYLYNMSIYRYGYIRSVFIFIVQYDGNILYHNAVKT